ncbi:MAG TPA: GAF domain-containing sensor histidine kinase [Thermomicrobiales bacterium]|nr:GAF domain-containing sensor histidine kinase [Thermomicrobiales bacterium]
MGRMGILTEPTLQRTRWVIYLGPPILLGGLELLRQAFFPDLFDSPALYALFLLSAIACMWTFSWVITRQVEQMRANLLYQNEELLALHHASMAIAGDLRLETVLQRVVDEAAVLVGAKYGAISLEHHDPHMRAFVTYGVDQSLYRQLGMHPVGTGLLGIPVRTGAPVRIPNVAEDSRAAGFPEGHPDMSRLLGVPVASGDMVVGNLYLADKDDGTPFTPGDEGTLVRFAALAGVAIANAVLHEQVEVLAITEERERIAREMHDSLAQVLAYVNTKSQAAQAHLANHDIERANAQIEQLAQTAREAYVDVREGIFALRSSHLPPDAGLATTIATYVQRWQDQTGIPVELTVPASTATNPLSPLAALHLQRLVQEALTNIRKHANATQVSITIEDSGPDLRVAIVDNGEGFDPNEIGRGTFPRFGLSTMRERAEASGGEFRLVSSPGRGTTIEVTLPMAASPGQER